MPEVFTTTPPPCRRISAASATIAVPCARTCAASPTTSPSVFYSMVRQLRADGSRYPSEPEVVGLVEDLLAGSEDFTRLWEQHDVQRAPMLTTTFLHPVVGDVTVDCDHLSFDDSDQHLVLHTAQPGSRDADASALLGVVGTQTLPTGA